MTIVNIVDLNCVPRVGAYITYGESETQCTWTSETMTDDLHTPIGTWRDYVDCRRSG